MFILSPFLLLENKMEIYIKFNMNKNLTRITIIMFIVILLTFSILKKISDIANPILLAFATQESYNTVTKIVNTAVNKTIDSNFNTDDMFILSNDLEGKIVSIDFDSIMINKITSLISLEIEKQLTNLDSNDYQIPFMIIFKNNFLTNLGPKIPVKIKLIGSVVNNFETKITNYGINNALIELYLKLELRINVALPFVSDEIVVVNSYPLAIKLINGNIPEYYAGNVTNPLLSLPIN